MQIHDFVSVCQGIYTRDQNWLPVFLSVVRGEQGVQDSGRESREGTRCSSCIPEGTRHISHYCSDELIAFFLHGTWCGGGVAWLGLSHFPWSALGCDQCANHKWNNFVHTVDVLSLLLRHVGVGKKARNTDFQLLRCEIQWITLSDCISSKPNKKGKMIL